MRRNHALCLWAILATVAVAAAQPTVTLTLESSQAGQTLSPGATVDWTITVSVSSGDNAGLALISCDLVQDAGNPAKLDIPPGDEASIDATMQNFSRPDGIANPGEGGATTGYVGVQRGTAGEMNLIQIGGGQNTFGEALPGGTGVGESCAVIGGVGQSGLQTVLSGSFAAPATEGTYTFSLTNALANVIAELNTPPVYSPVESATVNATAATFSFTVGGGYSLGDLNCDGSINGLDIDPFVLVLTSTPPSYPEYYAQHPGCDHALADCNTDGSVNGLDIDPFVAILTGGGG